MNCNEMIKVYANELKKRVLRFESFKEKSDYEEGEYDEMIKELKDLKAYGLIENWDPEVMLK